MFYNQLPRQGELTRTTVLSWSISGATENLKNLQFILGCMDSEMKWIESRQKAQVTVGCCQVLQCRVDTFQSPDTNPLIGLKFTKLG